MEQPDYPKYPAYPAYPNEEGEQGRSIDPDLIREIWQRRKWVGILIVGAVLACAVSAALSLPSLYRASAKVLVDRQEVSESFVRPTVTTELEPRIQAIQQQVMSRDRLANLINALNLYPEDRQRYPMEAVVERMRKDASLKLEGLEAQGRSSTVAFTVSYNGRDPVTTAKVANTLASYYVEENAKGRRRQAARTAAFLDRQVQELRAEMEQNDSKTGEYIKRHNSDLPQQLGANESALSRLSGRLQLNGEQQMRLAERRERVQKDIADATTGITNADTRQAEADLAKLKQDLAAAKNRYSDRYPEVVRLSNEVAAREAQLTAHRSAAKSTPPPKPAESAATLAEVDSQLASLRAEETALRSAIGSYEKRVASTPSRAMEMERLARGYDTTRERYQSLLKAYEDARVAASLEQGEGAEEFRVLDAAIPPREPIAPNRLWLLLIGLAAAAFAGAVGIAVAEKLDTSFHAPDDLRSFVKTTPILATIPRVFTAASTRRLRYRRALATGAAIVVLTLLAAGSWYVAAGNEMITRLTTRGA